MVAYEYLYYRLFKWCVKQWGEGHSLAQWNAVFTITALVTLNLFSIFRLLEVVTGINIFAGEETKSKVIALLVVLFFANYFAFLHRGRFLMLSKRFQDESSRKRKIGSMLVGLYITLTIIMFYVFGFYF